MGDELKSKMISGLAWTSFNVVGVQLIQLIVGIFLARMLHVEEFGQIGILFFFVGISTVLIDGGFAQALIRKKDATETDINTIFYVNLLLSVVLYGILYVATPVILHFFNLDTNPLVPRILFLSILVFSLYFIQQTQLTKRLDFRTNAIVNILSVVISAGVAIILVFYNGGIWVLVFQQLSFHISKALIFPFFLRWKPKLQFSWNTIKDSWRFSVGIFGQTLLNVVFNHIYTLLIGKFDTLRNVGYYTQANKYSETVNTATHNILTSSTFPIFSQVHDDKPRLLRIYRRLAGSVSMVTFPLAIFLIVAAEPIIISLITEKWRESIFLFQLLILANLFHPIYLLNISILNAQGLSKQTFIIEICKKLLIVISILLTYGFGIRYMLVGLIVSNFIAFAISAVYVKKSILHYYRHQLRDISTVLVLATMVGVAVFLVNSIALNSFAILSIQFVSYATLYLILIRVFFPTRWTEVSSEIKQKYLKQK